MQEKRLRKQEMEERAKALTEAGPDQKQAAEENLKRKVPKRVNLALPGSSSPSPTTEVPISAISTQRVPIRKLIPLKSKAASPLNSSTQIVTRGAAAASLPVNQNSFQQKPHKNTSQARQVRAVPQLATEDVPVPDITLKSNQKKLTTDTKGTVAITQLLLPSYFICSHSFWLRKVQKTLHKFIIHTYFNGLSYQLVSPSLSKTIFFQ